MDKLSNLDWGSVTYFAISPEEAWNAVIFGIRMNQLIIFFMVLFLTHILGK